MKKYINSAYKEALSAYADNEIPIGAVIVKDDEIIATGYNMREQLNDVSAHAEIIAMKRAAQITGSWKLAGCVMYVTIEPCLMCLAAISQSRIKTVYYGSKQLSQKKCGCSNFTGFDNLNVELIQVPDMNICDEVMTKFFKKLRGEKC